jgi:hypothetical protein
MTLYSIFEKSQGKAALQRGPVAVPERFSWFAAILPPIYALANGLILTFVFWIAVVGGLFYVSQFIGDDASRGLYILIALFIGFEAPALRRDALLTRGYKWQGDIIAGGEDLAQLEYLTRK